jgi:HEAT repeat protein
VRGIPLLARWVGRIGEEDELRRKACEALAEIADDAAMPALQRVFDDETASDDVRGEAARAAGIIGGKDAHSLLLRGLKHERPWILARSIQGVGCIGDRALLPRITPFLDAKRPWMVRTHAIEAAARLGGADALASLEPLASDPEARIRSELCVALGQIGGATPRACLRRLLDDPELPVRIQALGAYSRCTGQDFGFRVEDHQGALDPKKLEHALRQARTHAG